MPFITDDALKTRLAAVLKQSDPGDLADVWDGIISDANAAAYNSIVAHLAARGYTLAQIAAWDRRDEFNMDLGLYWALVKGAGIQAYDDRWVEKLNRLKELDEAIITIDGELVSAVMQTRIGHGRLATSDDEFVVDPDNPRRGTATRW